MELSPEKHALALRHMQEMAGGVIGTILLSADDYEATKASLHASVDEFPFALREMAGEARTFILMDSVRQVRTHSREFYRLLEEVAALKAAESGQSPEEARMAAMDAIATAAMAAAEEAGVTATPEDAHDGR